MSTTSIEWTDRTWNPVTGCTKVGPGCDRCYAEAVARRFASTRAFPDGFAVTLRPERLDAPLRRRTPAAVRFVSAEPLLAPIDLHEPWAGPDWLIVGGESGPGARRMDPAWAESLVTRCRALRVREFPGGAR